MRRCLCLALLLVATFAGPAAAQLRGARPELVRVTDRIYCASGYALGNVLYVVTDDSVVVIDATESPFAAQQTLDEFRKVCDLPIRYLIYTHFHGDHINGAAAFRNPELQVIAQRLHTPELQKYMMLRGYNTRLNAVQFGAALSKQEPSIELAMDPRRPTIGYLRPTIEFDDEYHFEAGGVRFELYHTIGETYDQLMVWLPDEKAVFPGDLFYESFPMLASPMKHDRPVLAWAESIDRMRELQPEYLVPSHTPPIVGREKIDTILANYAAAIRFVHDETVKRINQGLPLHEIRRQVKLPKELAELPYLAERYGRVEWGVTGVYRQYTGFYNGVPAQLNPGPPEALHRALCEASGGTQAIFERAQAAFDDGKYQLTLELINVVLGADAQHRDAHRLCAEALEKLASASINTVQRNIYRVAAQEHRQAADETDERAAK